MLGVDKESLVGILRQEVDIGKVLYLILKLDRMTSIWSFVEYIQEFYLGIECTKDEFER
jgi:hypothetical protein